MPLFLLLDSEQNCPEGKTEIIRELQRNSVTILVGETGSGKTTREPSSHIFCAFFFFY